jgi:excisionase family DNA binding protein
VYDLLSQGRLPHLKDGARVLIRRAELFGYLESVEH